MTDNVRYLSDLELHGNMTFAAPVTDFPASPKIGTFILKGTDLYAYLKIGDLETWFPFASGTNSFVQTQGVAAQNWTVTHNLGTTNVWFQVKDQNGVIQNVGKTDVNSNTFTVNFSCPMLGTIVVVAPDSINVPEVKAEVIRLGANVVIDTSGVTIGGNAVLTSASIATQIATAVTVESSRATAAEQAIVDGLATVATSGSYNDLADKPSVPTLPSTVSSFTNDSGYQTANEVNSAIQGVVGAAPAALDTLKEIADKLSSDESAVAALTSVVSGKENAITAGTVSQYFRGDKTWATMPTSSGSGSYNDLTDKPVLTTILDIPTVVYNNKAAAGKDYDMYIEEYSYLPNSRIVEFRYDVSNGDSGSIAYPGYTLKPNTNSGYDKLYTGSLIYNISPTAAIGQVLAIKIRAKDNLGNYSPYKEFSVQVANYSVVTPTITYPATNSTNVSNNFTIISSAFEVTSGYSDIHESTEWAIWTGAGGTGTRLFYQMSATNLTSIAIPVSTGLITNTVYYLGVRYKGRSGGYSNWSYSGITTAMQFPLQAGDAYAGGYYAGKVILNGITHNVVSAPKAMGGATMKAKLDNSDTPGTTSVIDSLGNSNIMNNYSHPAASFCRNLTIGGNTDWALPARDVLEVLYRVFKPTTQSNNPNAGMNVNSVPANLTTYAATDPSQTSLAAFQDNGTEAFATSFFGGMYWTSTTITLTIPGGSDAYVQAFQIFKDGTQAFSAKTVDCMVRAVRLVPAT